MSARTKTKKQIEQIKVIFEFLYFKYPVLAYRL